MSLSTASDTVFYVRGIAKVSEQEVSNRKCIAAAQGQPPRSRFTPRRSVRDWTPQRSSPDRHGHQRSARAGSSHSKGVRQLPRSRFGLVFTRFVLRDSDIFDRGFRTIRRSAAHSSVHARSRRASTSSHRERHFHPLRRHPFRDRSCHVDFKRRSNTVACDIFQLETDHQPVRPRSPRVTWDEPPDRFPRADRYGARDCMPVRIANPDQALEQRPVERLRNLGIIVENNLCFLCYRPRWCCFVFRALNVRGRLAGWD